MLARRISLKSRPLSRGGRNAIDPMDDVILEFPRLVFGNDAAAHRDSRLVHGVGIARHERMPPIKLASLVNQSIGASRRQPRNLTNVVVCERNAIFDQYPTKAIGFAAAALVVELPAGHVGPIDFPAVLVLELHET